MGNTVNKLDYLQTQTVQNILCLSGSQVGSSPVSGEVIGIDYNQTVGEALVLMSKHKLSSLPVYEKGSDHSTLDTCLGFVDVLDLSSLVVEFCQNSQTLSSFTEELAQYCNNQFISTPIDAVIDFSKRDPFMSLPQDSALLLVVKYFATGVHRLAVYDDATKKITSIVTQSAVLRHFAKNWSEFGGIHDLSIKSLRLGTSVSKDDRVYALFEGTSVVDALRTMRDKKLSAVAVVNEKFALVDTFSASDLKGYTYSDFSRFIVPVHSWKSKRKLCCVSEESTVREVVDCMIEHNIHRVYIVDDSKDDSGPVLVGVVSLTDLYQAIAKLFS